MKRLHVVYAADSRYLFPTLVAAASVAATLALRRLLPRRMAGILFGGR